MLASALETLETLVTFTISHGDASRSEATQFFNRLVTLAHGYMSDKGFEAKKLHLFAQNSAEQPIYDNTWIGEKHLYLKILLFFTRFEGFWIK